MQQICFQVEIEMLVEYETEVRTKTHEKVKASFSRDILPSPSSLGLLDRSSGVENR